MAKVPGFVKAFAGRWRIVEMDVWDNDFLDLVAEAHLTFKGLADGEIAFGALKGFLDVRYGTRDGSACAELSWEGHDENDSASGRGWAVFFNSLLVLALGLAALQPTSARRPSPEGYPTAGPLSHACR
ncbi:hypothetical protein [Mesorhizobium sp. M1338]|uniref:hypothetical protein n=1 Tax=Mesorhizobium sp. M1338 TaxID=2957085 RepID=UPI00333CB54A